MLSLSDSAMRTFSLFCLDSGGLAHKFQQDGAAHTCTTSQLEALKLSKLLSLDVQPFTSLIMILLVVRFRVQQGPNLPHLGLSFATFTLQLCEIINSFDHPVIQAV